MPITSSLRHTAKRVLGEAGYRRLQKSLIAMIGKERFEYLFLGGDFNDPKTRHKALERFAQNTMPPSAEEIRALHGREVTATLSLAIQYSYNAFIDGDIVEFGTASGVSARVIAAAMRAAEIARPRKKLHLFDSFVGLPAAESDVDKNSFEVKAGIWSPGTCRLLSKQELFEFCSAILDPTHVVMHEGWFADTVSSLPREQKFAFVHFDGDLYQSTIDAIGGLLQLGAISNGAIICFDDWNCCQADPNFGERKAWTDLSLKYDIVSSDWRSYSTMGRAFFIHDYRRT
jgi:O-methyltransferase